MANKSERTKSNGVAIKAEPSEMDLDDEEIDPPAFGPAALGLHRVGTQLPPKPTPSEPVQKLNARGMPARIRKKNRLFFDDEMITSPTQASPKRTPKTPAKTPKSAKKFNKSPLKTPKIKTPKQQPREKETSSPDQKAGQRIGTRLRNLLKLPKAHKWVCFEYFYSDIDKTLFEGENDFMICLKESFPQLKTRRLSRVQWAKIRRMMGKPRRCSQAFFNEERKELQRKREKMRQIQQHKIADLSYKDLPNEIPMQYVIGSKVTARLRRPQDGLFTGTVDAIDTSNNSYRITFERPKLGTHSVPDYEVLATDPPETLNVATLMDSSSRRSNFLDEYQMCWMNNFKVYNKDPLLGNNEDLQSLQASAVGGYPYKLLELIIRIRKILEIKKASIEKLKEFNSIAERRKSYGEKVPEDFERKYASVVVKLESLNSDLQEYLNDVQLFCNVMAPGPSIAAMLAPSHLREQCQTEAKEVVKRNNNGSLKDENVLGLITDLTALLLQIKSLSTSDRNAYELKVLRGTMEQIKMKLEPKLKTIFENEIEVHMLRIQMGLSQMSA